MQRLPGRGPRKTPTRISVAPPPCGKSVRDWIHLQVEILTDLYYPTFRVRAGAKGRVVRTPRGGSGLVVRLSSGHEVRQLTEAHVRVIGGTQAHTEP